MDSAAAARLDSLGKTDRPATHPREHCEVQRGVFAARLVGRPERAAGLMNPCAMENEWPINVQRHLQQHHFGAIQRLEVPRLLTVPGAAYQVTLDAPEFVLPAIEEFVKGRWPAGAERVRRMER